MHKPRIALAQEDIRSIATEIEILHLSFNP
jgi:hypothetical protein